MVVHICNNFVVSKVHYNLITKMQDHSEQLVLVPYRNANQKGNFENGNLQGKIEYIRIYNSLIKFFPFMKVILVTLLCFFSLKGRKPKYILAHTMWSDGVCAFLLSKVFNVKYSIVVRNTDMNVFLPKLLIYRWLISLVFENADNVIFVSVAHKRRLLKEYPNIYSKIINPVVVPNGIDDYWIENKIKKEARKIDQVCFVGKFDRNKNLDAIYNVSKDLIEKHDVKFNLVLLGGDVSEFKDLVGVECLPQWLSIVPKTNDNETICRLYRDSKVFFMPSHTETFGLVYFEALSQGCAIMATKGEGIDGYLVGDFAKFNLSKDYESMKGNLKYLLESYSNGVGVEVVSEYLNNLSWDQISLNYRKLIGIG